MFVKKIKYMLRRHPFLYRVRFALITRFGVRELFDDECSNKYCEKSKIPGGFFEVIDRLRLEKDKTLDSAMRIAFDLSHGHERGRGMSGDSATALRLIYQSNAGTCSDYSQVYLGLCIAAGIKVREWGLEDDFLSSPHGIGHAYNEVYSTELNKWVFVDAYRSVYAVEKLANVPLGVIEIVDLATSGLPDRVEFRYIDEDQRGKESCHHAELYLDPTNVFYLMSRNNVFRQDRFLRWNSVLPLPFLHIPMIALGSYQEYWIYTNSSNMELMRHKFDLLKRGWILAALFKIVTFRRLLQGEKMVSQL